MPDIATNYSVEFVNYYHDDPITVSFNCADPKDVKAVVEALSSHYSGDPCECFINGQEAVLENDWGLMIPQEET